MLIRRLLHALSAGQPVSGAVLAQEAGMTRAAIWKHVAALRKQGLPISAQAGKGYCLPWPIQLLEPDAIRNSLATKIQSKVEVCWEVDSTQSALYRQHHQLPDLSFLISETQGAGRGRRGSVWQSPPGRNLYLSCLKRFDQGLSQLAGLPKQVGGWVIAALNRANTLPGARFENNDIRVGTQKVGGILIDLMGEYDGPVTAIIGIGLTPLAHEGFPDRNQLAVLLIDALYCGLAQLDSTFTQE